MTGKPARFSSAMCGEDVMTKTRQFIGKWFRTGTAALLATWLSALAIAADEEAIDSGGVIFQTDNASRGVYLIAPIQSRDSYLIDTDGMILNRWQSAYPLGMSAYLSRDGSLLRGARVQPPENFRRAGGSGGRVQRIAWDGEVTWDFWYSGAKYFSHHDVHPMPNGNVLLTAWDYISPEEALKAGRKPDQLSENGIWVDTVVEVKPTGKETGQIVWKWSAWDHLVQNLDPKRKNYGEPASRPERIDLNYVTRRVPDWTHVNGIDYNEELDQILLSVAFFNEIWVIDHGTTTQEAAGSSGGTRGKGGDLLFRWGNPAAYGRGTEKDQHFYMQHDARWIQPGHPGEGNILIFNNGTERPVAPYSTIVEITPPLTSKGDYALKANAPWGPKELSWRYRAKKPLEFYAPRISGTQRLPNGNTLICSGPAGIVFEVNPSGEQVWQFVNPFGQSRGAPVPPNGQITPAAAANTAANFVNDVYYNNGAQGAGARRGTISPSLFSVQWYPSNYLKAGLKAVENSDN